VAGVDQLAVDLARQRGLGQAGPMEAATSATVTGRELSPGTVRQRDLDHGVLQKEKSAGVSRALFGEGNDSARPG
jgi:hypothetical protein